MKKVTQKDLMEEMQRSLEAKAEQENDYCEFDELD